MNGTLGRGCPDDTYSRIPAENELRHNLSDEDIESLFTNYVLKIPDLEEHVRQVYYNGKEIMNGSTIEGFRVTLTPKHAYTELRITDSYELSDDNIGVFERNDRLVILYSHSLPIGDIYYVGQKIEVGSKIGEYVVTRITKYPTCLELEVSKGNDTVFIQERLPLNFWES